jgi:hypothetical protein
MSGWRRFEIPISDEPILFPEIRTSPGYCAGPFILTINLSPALEIGWDCAIPSADAGPEGETAHVSPALQTGRQSRQSKQSQQALGVILLVSAHKIWKHK